MKKKIIIIIYVYIRRKKQIKRERKKRETLKYFDRGVYFFLLILYKRVLNLITFFCEPATSVQS
jgi:hypothetical protein